MAPGVAVLNGVSGTWLSPRDANRVFFVLGTCVPAYRALVLRQETLSASQLQLARTSSAALSAARTLVAEERERGDVWRQAYQEEHKLRMTEQDAAASWVRAPVLWFALGTLLVGAAVVGTAAAVGGL